MTRTNPRDAQGVNGYELDGHDERIVDRSLDRINVHRPRVLRQRRIERRVAIASPKANLVSMGRVSRNGCGWASNGSALAASDGTDVTMFVC